MVFGGKPRQVLQQVISGHCDLCFSEALLEEVHDVLAGPKFKFPPDVLLAVIQELVSIGKLVSPQRRIGVIHEDPEDNRILECAVEAGAEFIISGDKHLLRLGAFENIRIVTCAGFLALMK